MADYSQSHAFHHQVSRQGRVDLARSQSQCYVQTEAHLVHKELVLLDWDLPLVFCCFGHFLCEPCGITVRSWMEICTMCDPRVPSKADICLVSPRPRHSVTIIVFALLLVKLHEPCWAPLSSFSLFPEREVATQKSVTQLD